MLPSLAVFFLITILSLGSPTLINDRRYTSSSRSSQAIFTVNIRNVRTAAK